jgi:hypothetical protein
MRFAIIISPIYKPPIILSGAHGSEQRACQRVAIPLKPIALYHEKTMRIHGRTDKNQTEIVQALREAGVKVAITSDLGNGFPDALCKFRGVLYLLEIKSKGGRLTQEERDFFDDWQDVTTVVYSIEEAFRAVGAKYD